MRDVCFDGLVGPTHSYAGLSPGNLAAMRHVGQVGNPRAAARQGLAKMRFAASLGGLRAVLPPHPRPDVSALRRLGYAGSDRAVLERVAREAPELLRSVCSASSMWAANAATVAPATDTLDGRTHLVVANLSSMFHRSLEASVTQAVLEKIFAADRFVVHPPLPAGAHFSDEGAANHVRLHGGVHLFGWGRRALGSGRGSTPQRHPARQTCEASAAVARWLALPPESVLLWQQHPAGIDAGAFHSDVLAVGHGRLLLLHELAFADAGALIAELERRVDRLEIVLATERELPVADAVAAYPFNSELVELERGELAILAPLEARETEAARRFLERVVAVAPGVGSVHYIDVNASMKNGGGPACLRLRVPLSEADRALLGGRVRVDDDLLDALELWVDEHYRDRLSDADFADPALLDESRRALDELTTLLELGSIYDFQQP